MKVLVSITSTGKPNFNERIKEIKELAIDEIALFVTAIEKNERKNLYELLKKSKITKIPFVHLRADMKVDELDFLVENFGTEIFNIHGAKSRFPFTNDFSKYDKKIFLEVQYHRQNESELNKYGGICLDVCHLEDFRLRHSALYGYYLNLMENHKVGCGHISAIKKWPLFYWKGPNFTFGHHSYSKLNHFDYLKRYKNILAPVMALELENSIIQQIEAKKYIEKILL